MKTKRIVITGGPGTGKTTLIDQLEELGYNCLHEVSRHVTLEAQKKGVDQLFLEDPILFSRLLLKGRLEQFYDAEQAEEPVWFYDRGLPDITSYLNYLDCEYPVEFDDSCKLHRYDRVFLLPPWEEIYEQDNERYESFEQAGKIYSYLLNGYEGYGYEVVEIPPGSTTERTTFILQNLKDLL